MKRRRALLLSAIPVVLLCAVSSVWLHVQQQQYARNRQLIAALIQNDTKQALALVNAGADPNTRFTPTRPPSFLELVNQLLHGLPSPVNDSPTAFMMACGAGWPDEHGYYFTWIKAADPSLTQTMLLHGANVNAKDAGGMTALHWVVAYPPNKDLIKQLLEYGADPNSVVANGWTAIEQAETYHRPDIVALLKRRGK